MVSRSTLGARAGIPARLLSVTYDRPVIIRLNYAKTRPIAAIGRVFPCRTHGRASISNFIYRALDPHVSTGIVMGAALMTISVDTCGSSAL